MFARGKLDSNILLANTCHSVYYCLSRDRVRIFILVGGGGRIIRICLKSTVAHNDDATPFRSFGRKTASKIIPTVSVFVWRIIKVLSDLYESIFLRNSCLTTEESR